MLRPRLSDPDCMIDKNQTGFSTVRNSRTDATSNCLNVSRVPWHFITAFFLLVAVGDSVFFLGGGRIATENGFSSVDKANITG